MSGAISEYKAISELPQPFIEQLEQKIKEAIELGFAEITIVIKRKQLDTIRGPTPSERIRLK